MEYMEMLTEEDPERYKAQFAKYIENDIEADGVEDMWKECHSNIRESPKYEKEPDQGITHKREGNKITSSNGNSYTRAIKRSKAQRMDRVKQKMATAKAKLLAAGDAM